MSEETGLERSWKDNRVFVNPPYTRGEIEKWVTKMIEERNSAKIIVALLPAAIGTRWYKRVKEHATVYELDRRVHFVDPDTGKPGDSPPGGHVLAVFMPDLM